MTEVADNGGNQAQAPNEQRRILLDASTAAASYANTCHVASTKEEIILNFGLNQSWEQNPQGVRVQVTNRIILSPFAAKRLALLLSAVVQQYEGQFGVLDLNGPAAGTGSPSRSRQAEPSRS